jgi:hypothetical protein
MLRCAKHERDEICRVLQGPARSRSGLYTGVYFQRYGMNRAVDLVPIGTTRYFKKLYKG